jgi:hypothetical protein
VTGKNFLDYVGQYVTIYFENGLPSEWLLKNFTVPTSTWSQLVTVPHSAGGERDVEVWTKGGRPSGIWIFNAWELYTVESKIWVTPDPGTDGRTDWNNGTIATVHGTGLMYSDDDGAYVSYDLCIDVSKDIFAWSGFGDGWVTYFWPNATGDLVTATEEGFQFLVGAGFTGGKHSVALYKETMIQDYPRLPSLDAYYLFTVNDVKEDVILKKLNDISTAITDLGSMKAQLTAIQTAITNAQSALSTQISGLSTRLTSIETYAQTASTSAATAAASAAAASTAAAGAKTAAEQASATTSTISTAVYGAIVLSLIAALASIVAVITLQKKVA